MFTPVIRKEVLDHLLGELSRLDDVLGVILVGSGAKGFRDKYSDIDIAIVYDVEKNVQDIFDKVYNIVSEKYSVATVLNQYGRNLQIFLLLNYLEIDIGYYNIESIEARRGNFKVVFDRTDMLCEIMNKSWKENATQYMGTTSNVDIQAELFRTDANLWYNVFHTVNSFLRSERYRCYFEIEELRRNLLSLVGKRKSVESKRYRDIHKLEISELECIEELFCYPKTNTELKNMLCRVIEMFYSEYAYRNYNSRLEKDYLLKYVYENLDEIQKEK